MSNPVLQAVAPETKFISTLYLIFQMDNMHAANHIAVLLGYDGALLQGRLDGKV